MGSRGTPATVAVAKAKIGHRIAARLDLKALAAAASGRKAVMAEAAAAERATGYVVGGISPLGHRKQLPVFLDDSMRDRPSVLVSAGRRGLELELSPADLARLSDGTFATLAILEPYGRRRAELRVVARSRHSENDPRRSGARARH